MDVEKLIERLEAWNEQHLSVVCGSGHFACDYLCESEDCIVVQAATALSTLQAENKRLNKIVCSIPTTPDSGRTVSQYDKEMSMCAYLDDLEAENEKLRTELEQVKRENDALWTYIEIVDREYRRYMDRGYIDRLDELKKVWKNGQKED